MNIETVGICPTCGGGVSIKDGEQVYVARDREDALKEVIRIVRDYAIVSPVFSKDVEKEIKDLMEES